MSDNRNAPHNRLRDSFEKQPEPQLPSHERVLLIARVALRDPSALTRDEIKELASAMIMHYAQMGIG